MKKNTAVPHATPRHATPRHATPRHATPRHATPRQLIPHVASSGKHHLAHTLVPSHDTTRHDTTRHDTTRHDTTRHDTTRHDTTRHDTTKLIAHSASSGKFHFVHILKPSYRSLLFLLAAGVFLFSCDEPKEIELSSEASLTSLTLTVGSTDHEVTFTGTQHTLKVGSYGTEIPATVGVKDIVLSSGATTDAGNELSVTNNAVTLTVTAADGTTRKTYTVTLVFTTAGITSFTFEVPGNESMALDTADHKRIVGTIDQEAKTITFDEQSAYVYLDKLKATFEVSEAGAKVQVGNEDQTSGTTEQDFSAPVSYVVSAEGTETTTYRVTLAKSTLATIPDAQFRKKLKEFVPDAFTTEDQLDITHDDVVNKDGDLSVGNQRPKLTSLKGIEFFTALDTLDCRFNTLASLDLRKNTALKILACDNNSLASLDLRKNTALTQLYCQGNDLTSLDVSVNTALTELQCYRSSLTSLDVSANTALVYLDCGGNALTSLDVSANTALTELDCGGNALTSLDVSANTALTTLYCGENDLTSLDMTGMRSVTALSIGTGTGTDLEPDNRLLATIRINIAIQDLSEIVTTKENRMALTITTVNNDGDVVCNDYDPLTGTCITP